MLQKHISQYSDDELRDWVQHLVSDEIAESMTLEYKSGEAFGSTFKREIAKDISSFANTRGGIIIYGMPEKLVSAGREEKAIPCHEYGIAPIPNFVSRLEDILTETVLPHLPDLWIQEAPVAGNRNQVVYIVWHPESWLGPHMVQGFNEQRYYRRGLRRTIRMAEAEVREAYIKVQRTIERAERFLHSTEVDYLKNFFADPVSISQVVSCPQLLVENRVNYNGPEMMDWLRRNMYPQRRVSPDGSGVTWYPSIYGAQAGMVAVPAGLTTGQQTLKYWAELHRNGAVNCLWESRIVRQNDVRLLDWSRELGILWDFIKFNKEFHLRIGYYGPLRFRFSISKLAFVELKPSDFEEPLAAQLPNNTFTAELVEDSARLFQQPTSLLQTFANLLFQAFGKWEAPTLISLT